MRDFAISFKRLFLAVGALLALISLDRPALAANPAELNFGLFGPSYDGRVKECGAALGTITSQFQEKESNFWNSPLQIVGYGNIHEIAFRPWQSDNIPRRFCSGNVQLKAGLIVNELNVSGNAGLAESAAGSDGPVDAVSPLNELRAGDLWVYINDANNSFTADELARIESAEEAARMS